MTTVAITGASGFIGRELVRQLSSRGTRVIALTRGDSRAESPDGVEVRRFDFAAEPNPAAFDGATHVVHLSGESIAGRWSEEKKRRIEQSRVDGTRRLIASLAPCNPRPTTLVCASAVGYYGSRGDERLVESSPPGDDFLARVVTAWEAAAREASALGMRVVMVRAGVVLGDGGALAQMKTPFLFGAGGPLGSGRQYLPWIHLRDLASIFAFALENENLAGPVNAVAPDPATNARFAKALGAALHRPALVPTPAFALRLILGEFAETLLGSQLVIPAALEAARFTWSFPRLEAALAEIFT